MIILLHFIPLNLQTRLPNSNPTRRSPDLSAEREPCQERKAQHDRNRNERRRRPRRQRRSLRLRSCCAFLRSEEHTSELQSPYDLVCRLLLETKHMPSMPLARSSLPSIDTI